ncbi:sugar ABC transporter ATP-binding protein [Peribacillus huizhouensis]|uniref:Ribose transport system ATP-binding protein n=1 Tax=Peribacillus huizhouensis TaxID=1501239 RepID=A0ABR6CMT8_9BACI|nr:sugar ABC transporter ATP-binding protein [Peribacillus huizhouensis]MBA9026354.1 ribose transport system ATP-binding protein [Peribacillus huizhouensis]
MNSPIIELKHITKSFSGVKALTDVSLTVHPGSVHALVGENGAGKSTLMKILTGAYSKSSGEIFYKGEKVENMDPKTSKKLGIHCIYQELNVANYLTVAENVFLGSQPVNKLGLIDWKQMNQTAKEIFASLQINLDPKQMAKDISIAQKQMIEIARAISQDAKILIMDEPTSSLSERETEILLSLVTELKNKGVSILYISHRMDEIFKVCDTVTVLRDGKYIKSLPMSEVKDVDSLVELMVNRKMESYFNKIEVPIGETILDVQNLSKTGVLNNINFNLRSGEILGIAGLVGSGRTEIAQALFGMLKKDAGEILIDNKKVEIKGPSDAIKLGIGFVTENRKETGLVLKQTVRDNISLPNLRKYTTNLFINKKAEKKESEDYKKKLNIKTRSIEQTISTLSGGNQQKAIISRWMIQEPRILILDEPCRGVDVGAKAEIFAQISKLAEQGVGIIMISSEIAEIVGMSDRTIVMREGTLAGELEKDMITSDNILKLAFGGGISA